MFKKKRIIILLSIIVLCGVGIIGFKQYQKHELINNKTNEIEEIVKKFNDLQTRDEKMNLICSLIEEYDTYKGTDNSIEDIYSIYETNIENMRNYFIDSYGKVIKDNTLKSVDKIEDKSKLNNSKNNLNNLLKMINSEKNTILNEKEASEYEEKISSLIELYNKRIKDIEKAEAEKKAEEERKAKEEAERKKAEEAKKQQVSNNSKNSSSNGGSANNGSTNNKPSSNNSGSSSGWKKPWFELQWEYDLETGEKIPGTDRWFDPIERKLYDLNGNLIGWEW